MAERTGGDEDGGRDETDAEAGHRKPSVEGAGHWESPEE
jgi:hypothetical protein